MSRATRVEYPGALYHAMGRGIEGREVFPEDEHRERFLRFVGKAVESGDLIVHAYCHGGCAVRGRRPRRRSRSRRGRSSATVLRVQRIGWRLEKETKNRV